MPENPTPVYPKDAPASARWPETAIPTVNQHPLADMVFRTATGLNALNKQTLAQDGAAKGEKR